MVSWQATGIISLSPAWQEPLTPVDLEWFDLAGLLLCLFICCLIKIHEI